MSEEPRTSIQRVSCTAIGVLRTLMHTTRTLKNIPVRSLRLCLRCVLTLLRSPPSHGTAVLLRRQPAVANTPGSVLIVIRTHDVPKKTCIPLCLCTIFGPDYDVPPVIGRRTRVSRLSCLARRVISCIDQKEVTTAVYLHRGNHPSEEPHKNRCYSSGEPTSRPSGLRRFWLLRPGKSACNG